MSTQNKAVLVGALLVFVMALALVVVAVVNNQNGSVIESQEFNPELLNTQIATIPSGLGGLEVGDQPEDFTLVGLDGADVSLSDFAGQPVIINFWATWCAPCRFEMPEFQAVYEEYQDDGLVILALAQAQEAEIVQDYFNEFELTFTALLDTRTKVSADFGAYGVMPSTYFVAPDGTISGVWRGPLNAELLDEFLQEILPTETAAH